MTDKLKDIEPHLAATNYQLEDQELIDGLRLGNETAFLDVVSRFHTLMLRVATLYVQDHAVAEEIVQDTWIGVVEGIHRFEGRSSLKTWIFKILTNRAKRRRDREARIIPFSELGSIEIDEGELAVDAQRFNPAYHPKWPGGWKEYPKPWNLTPEAFLLSRETLQIIQRVVEALPQQQRVILELHDIERLSSKEVCSLLNLSQTNQRVLLHRARSKVRRALESYILCAD